MATMKSSGDLITSISTDMADNNAGLISAQDVRHNMEDTAFSINKIVSSGDTETEFPFRLNVTIKQDVAGDTGAGRVYVESGIIFPNHHTTDTQLEPWLGVAGLQHDDLGGLPGANPHTQYYKTDGTNPLTDDFVATHSYWINGSGHEHVGFRFNPAGGEGDRQQDIMTSGTFKFDDGSSISNGKGVAKAWCNFDASGVGLDNLPVIRSWHNISGVTRLAPGKLKITFTSGVFTNNHYVAMGTANATTSSGSKEDMSVNTVGIVLREGDDLVTDRTCTYVIKNTAGAYVDSERCDFVAYGYEPGESSGTVPTAVKASDYSDP